MTHPDPRPRAVVLGVQLPGVSDGDFESSIVELERLAATLGLEPVARVVQRRDFLAAAAVVGRGKLDELAAVTGGTGKVPTRARRKKRRIDEPAPESSEDDGELESEGAEGDEPASGCADAPARWPEHERAGVVLVDHDITPSQARNLELATGAEVLDRTSVILSIFQRHARSRVAKLQVELARLEYVAPRLRESSSGGDRVRGGKSKGAGESSLELDRRRIRDRMAELRRQIAEAAEGARVRRVRRTDASVVALVGYTNAGKSSLMRALTGSEVYVADKLFATLDTTVRVLVPETRPRILVSDTVGFIKSLPHSLVASFRSTLEEAREADLLLHVVDAADPAFRAQLAVTREVLEEIGAGEVPSLLILNKRDLLPEGSEAALLAEYPEALVVSARRPGDVAALHRALVDWFERDLVTATVHVPHAKQRLLGVVHDECRVLSERWDEAGAELAIRAPAAVLGRLRAELEDSSGGLR
ncbi:MAG: GTPase HflX [Polyangiaceae bacterium]|nr:GTPase HflX [Polyangiaceae bacterium]